MTRADHPASAPVEILDAEAGVVKVLPPRRAVALVGYVPRTRVLAPFEDPDWEVWGLNQLYRLIPRADRWFEIHTRYQDHVVEGTDHLGWLQSTAMPIYMDQVHPEVPTSVRYPLDRVAAQGRRYFTSTVAYMLGLALTEGFSEIGLYGIDLVVGDEYVHQRPCVEFWLGLAMGRGVTITLPPGCPLVAAPALYGAPEPETQGVPETVLEARAQDLNREAARAAERAAFIAGQLDEAKRWRTYAELRSRGAVVTYPGPEDRR